MRGLASFAPKAGQWTLILWKRLSSGPLLFFVGIRNCKLLLLSVKSIKLRVRLKNSRWNEKLARVVKILRILS